MNQELKEESDKLVALFLETMPPENYQRYSKQKLHHQLSYFYCWATLIKDEFK